MSTQTEHPPPTVELNGAAIDALAATEQYGSLTALARAAGIAPSTLARCRRGELAPGATVIAALLRTTGRPFDELFVV